MDAIDARDFVWDIVLDCINKEKYAMGHSIKVYAKALRFCS